MATYEETTKALQDSVVHWRENLRAAKAGERVSMDGADCPLCRVFSHNLLPLRKLCMGCPIYEHTGRRDCAKTPYEKAALAVHDDKDTFVKAVRAEYKFLKKLLKRRKK